MIVGNSNVLFVDAAHPVLDYLFGKLFGKVVIMMIMATKGERLWLNLKKTIQQTISAYHKTCKHWRKIFSFVMHAICKVSFSSEGRRVSRQATGCGQQMC
jgi:hypothetical protein